MQRKALTIMPDGTIALGNRNQIGPGNKTLNKLHERIDRKDAVRAAKLTEKELNHG